jgi:hypothetical protein
VKALATGNPLLMDKAEADTALARLARAEHAHLRNQDALRHAITRHERDVVRLTQLAADIDSAVARRQDTRGEAFTMTVDGHRHAKRAEAGHHLKTALLQAMTGVNGLRSLTTRPGQLGGFVLTATTELALGTTTVTLALDGAPSAEIRIAAADIRDADPVGLITRLEGRLQRLEERKEAALADAERARREIAHAREALGQLFPHAVQLDAARERARQIDEQLQQMAEPGGTESAEPDTNPTARRHEERDPHVREGRCRISRAPEPRESLGHDREAGQ